MNCVSPLLIQLLVDGRMTTHTTRLVNPALRTLHNSAYTKFRKYGPTVPRIVCLHLRLRVGGGGRVWAGISTRSLLRSRGLCTGSTASRFMTAPKRTATGRGRESP